MARKRRIAKFGVTGIKMMGRHYRLVEQRFPPCRRDSLSVWIAEQWDRYYANQDVLDACYDALDEMRG